MKNRSAATAAFTLAALLLLTGCTGGAQETMPGMDHGGGSSAPPATTSASDTDVMFASMMIPHHAQAIEMSDVLLAKGDIDGRVTELAQGIKAAQQPEIDRMQQWLEDWGADSSDGDAMQHGDGMMSEDDMQMLANASGAEAEQLFLSQMIQHHRGAVDMAQAEIDNGSNAAAIALAKTIVEAQMAEIAMMEQLQSTL